MVTAAQVTDSERRSQLGVVDEAFWEGVQARAEVASSSAWRLEATAVGAIRLSLMPSLAPAAFDLLDFEHVWSGL
eukprot:7074735-Pyramimonas_sp.AAC.1